MKWSFNRKENNITGKDFFVCVMIVLGFSLKAQVPGEWTWKHGVLGANYNGSYGTKGVPSSTNKPPGLYEAAEWTDMQGNFWLYGGGANLVWPNDLWKYTVATNQWTWVHGSGGTVNIRPVYGSKGIANAANTPGARSTSVSWTGNSNNLWLYSGFTESSTPGLADTKNDLWKYDMSINMWTWMRGDSGTVTHHYGQQGIESPLNQPADVNELAVSWKDNTGDLWMLDLKGCLWRYRISTNNWTWIKGDTLGHVSFGVKGVTSASTTPGDVYFDYLRWKDSNDNFWFMNSRGSSYDKTLFKYQPSTNMWTWIWGDTTYIDDAHYGTMKCDLEEEVTPYPRLEARACWTDACDNLWMMGGAGIIANNNVTLNDLVYYNIQNDKWTWAKNDTTIAPNSVFGTQGVSSPNNKPAGREGANPFKDAQGNLWVYGGLKDGFTLGYRADLWMYAMDGGCPPCENITGVKDNADRNKLTLFPNPSSG